MHDHLYLGLLVMCMVTWLGISQNKCLLDHDTNDECQQQQQPFNGRLSGTTRVGRYQKKHSPTHTHAGQRTSLITFLHL